MRRTILEAYPTVLVLGAAGFVGRYVAKEFADMGCRVLGLGHGRWGEEEWRAWGLVGWTASDICSESLDQVFESEKPQCIVHCGGSGAVSFSYTNPLQDFERTTHSTAQVLDWIRMRAPEMCRFVLVSSAAVYGDHGDADVTEKCIRAPISPYGVHKVVAEQLCESYSRFFGIACTVVRLFSVYGEGLRKQLLWDALKKFEVGKCEFLGTGNELRDWIHVRDAARLLALAGLTNHSSFEIYNGGCERDTTFNLLTRLSIVYGHSKPIVFSGESHKGNPRRLTSDSCHAVRSLNWSPQIRLDEGLIRYVKWFNMHK